MSLTSQLMMSEYQDYTIAMPMPYLRGGGRISVMGLGGGAYPPLFQCAVLSLEGDPVRVAVYTAALTGSLVLVLADAWSGRIVGI